MAHPQSAIFDADHRHFHVLEYTVNAEASPRRLRKRLARILQTLSEMDLRVVLAFGPTLWAALTPSDGPASFQGFTALDGKTARAPSTQRDLLLWLQGPARDQVLDGALCIESELAEYAHADLDLSGFVYHDSRDLTGFVDGTANPKEDARFQAALVPAETAGAGGSFVLTQKWIHDLAAFGRLPVPEQEQVIGRTKAESIELEGADMPADSHVSRTDIQADGVPQKMFRRSFPYGGAVEKGLYFLAFACEQSRFDSVLKSMFGLDEQGIEDRLLQFSTPTTGSYFFAPSLDALERALD